MRKVFLILIGATALAQTLPTLPAVSTVTSAKQTCTFTVLDPMMSVATDCVLNDGTVIYQSVSTAQEKGVILGAGQIMCLMWKTTEPKVRLQCSKDEDVAIGPQLVLDGVLAPVTKVRRWVITWR